MADVYRVTMRLSPEVYAQLEAAGRTGKPLATIARDALIAYLTRQSQQLWQSQQPRQPQWSTAHRLTPRGPSWGSSVRTGMNGGRRGNPC
jgi:hypothetical protein